MKFVPVLEDLILRLWVRFERLKFVAPGQQANWYVSELDDLI